MSFYMRDYSSEEKYDIAKFLNFEGDVYDVLASPFLIQLQQLPTVQYYNVSSGFKDIDLIAAEVYEDSFFAYLIQFYNNDFRETFPEGTVLKLFSVDNLNDIYYNLFALSRETE